MLLLPVKIRCDAPHCGAVITVEVEVVHSEDALGRSVFVVDHVIRLGEEKWQITREGMHFCPKHGEHERTV